MDTTTNTVAVLLEQYQAALAVERAETAERVARGEPLMRMRWVEGRAPSQLESDPTRAQKAADRAYRLWYAAHHAAIVAAEKGAR